MLGKWDLYFVVNINPLLMTRTQVSDPGPMVSLVLEPAIYVLEKYGKQFSKTYSYLKAWPGGYKTFSMLNSAEYEIYPAQMLKCQHLLAF